MKRIARHLMLAVALILAVLAMIAAIVNEGPSPWGMPGILGLWGAGFAGVGFAIAGRRPDHPVGWLLLASGILAGVTGSFGFDHAAGASPFATAVMEFSWVPAVAGLITALALLPDGRLPSRRWRPFLWLLWGAVTLMGVVVFAGEGFLDRLVVEILLQVALLPMLAAVAVRFARSRGTERQQLKWIAYAGGMVLAAALGGEIVARFAFPQWYYASTVVLSLAVLAIPLAIAMAILRYRLYDIDRIISRTVAYGAVTAVLAAAYVGVVFVLRLLFPGGSQLAVAASTLTVAALFNPLRRRTQVLVDRRFNRARYDAVQVIDSFAARIRSGAGTQALAGELLELASRTMEPTTASVWLQDRPK